jgi:diadenosine tetraphosphate (Ap4A) HIT family hydrolase
MIDIWMVTLYKLPFSILGKVVAYTEKDCTFCMIIRIIRKEKPADFVYEDESVVVIKDIRPHAPVHLLIVPRKHIRSMNDLTQNRIKMLFIISS